jgi:diadenosine tetraphosphatase ApaH/serine/threonine PP2A family protein phosphatase
VLSDAPEPAKRELVERGGVDALLYGHIHFPYIQHIDGKLLASIGSVGAPFDGDTRSCFAIATDDGDGWRVEHVRVEYDVEGHARAVEQSGMPESDVVVAGLRSARSPGAHARTASDE